MAKKNGFIALMGSGEMTSTMVEVHKSLLSQVPEPANPVFLDTPAGFQLNADDLSRRAEDYFRDRVQHPMTTASFKSLESTGPLEAEKAYRKLRDSFYILIGPGSPTYAVKQWQPSPVPGIILERIQAGGCLVAASAAALTIGRFTLPVYEIYKVGSAPYWEEGLDLLSGFGINLVVIPHWNNAEGGTHDTRFCYMGEKRFRILEAQLPDDAGVLGLDEHTACLLDLAKEEAVVRGIGGVTLRLRGREAIFAKGDRISLDTLRGRAAPPKKNGGSGAQPQERDPSSSSHTARLSSLRPPSDSAASLPEDSSFWERIHAIEQAFQVGLEKNQTNSAVSALLELDQLIWRAQRDSENPEFISQGREILREFIVYLGVRLEKPDPAEKNSLAPMVEALVDFRDSLRKQKRWSDTDSIRNALEQGGIQLEDTAKGSRWRWV